MQIIKTMETDAEIRGKACTFTGPAGTKHMSALSAQRILAGQHSRCRSSAESFIFNSYRFTRLFLQTSFPKVKLLPRLYKTHFLSDDCVTDQLPCGIMK